MSRDFGVYLHWPYCSAICPYCDFNVYRARGDDNRALIDAMLRDAAAYRALIGARAARTLFFGGGTPSLLQAAELETLIDGLHALFPLTADAEITLECNPEDASRFADQATAGINRFSIGVQALNDSDLRMLGRMHDAAAARSAIEAAARTGARVSIDMIYARPNQTEAAWRAELSEALTLPIEHASLYQLTIEEGTAFAHAVARGALAPPPDAHAAALYETTQELCAVAGFHGYEISNHARAPAAQSQHNLLYWRAQDWIGLGPGAHGRLTVEGGVRLALESSRRPLDYVNATGGGDLAARIAALSADEAVDEALLMGLRLDEGVARAALAERPPRVEVEATLAADELIAPTPTHIALTARGRVLADRIAAMLAA